MELEFEDWVNSGGRMRNGGQSAMKALLADVWLLIHIKQVRYAQLFFIQQIYGVRNFLYKLICSKKLETATGIRSSNFKNKKFFSPLNKISSYGDYLFVVSVLLTRVRSGSPSREESAFRYPDMPIIVQKFLQSRISSTRARSYE